MRILVTGGAGFIGSALVRRAIALGHAVLNVDKLTYAASPSTLDAVNNHPRYCFSRTDICDLTKVSSLISSFCPEVIMHLAAESHVDRSIDGPGEFISTNITGTYTLLEAARSYVESGAAPTGFRFHHVSTDEVFGTLGAVGRFSEDSPHRPNSPYAASKASADMLVRSWSETYRLPAIISNCTNNYGPYQFPEKLIPLVILKARAEETIPVYGAGENIRDWLYVEDHVDALLKVAGHGRPGSTYLIGGGEEYRNIDVVRRICEMMDDCRPRKNGKPHASLIEFVDDRPGHDQRYAVDAGRIARELGWHPQTTFEHGLRLTLEWYLQREDWWRPIQERRYRGERLGKGS